VIARLVQPLPDDPSTTGRVGPETRTSLAASIEELATILSSTPPGEPPDFGRITEMAGRYDTTFHMERLPEIMEKHGVELQ
jgi:hypothetical protein